MRLLPVILLAFCTSLFAQAPTGAVKTFKLDTPLPSPARGPLMVDVFSGGTPATSSPDTPVNPTPAPPDGLPLVPASVPHQAEGPSTGAVGAAINEPPVASAPNGPAPVKVYETLSQAAADGVNPLAPTPTLPVAAPGLKNDGTDLWAWGHKNAKTAGLTALLLALVGVALWLRRRNREE